MSKAFAQLCIVCLFGAKSALRRRASFWPLWLAFAITVAMLMFLSITAQASADMGTSNSLTAILSASEVTTIYKSLLVIGISVCLLQSQLLILRVLREERRQLLQLATVGINPTSILLAKGVEYFIHAVCGALIGGAIGGLAVSIFLPSTVAPVAIVRWILLLSTLIPLTCVPTALLFVSRFLSKPQLQHDIMF